jgi:hypothetical protein
MTRAPRPDFEEACAGDLIGEIILALLAALAVAMALASARWAT